MENVPRRADGRRIFSAEFKQAQLARVERGEVTMAELARELGVIPGLVRRWKYLVQKGGQTAKEPVVPMSALRAAEQRIRDLERALGKKTMEVDILRTAQEEVKKRPSFYGVS